MTLNVEVLESSFEKVKANADYFAIAFYQNLFTDYPEVKPLFTNTDMERQGKKLFDSLVLVVENVRHPELVEKVLQDLGKRHIEYRVLPSHYELVGNSLLKTLKTYLGSGWTPKVEQAWKDAYQTISNLMLNS